LEHKPQRKHCIVYVTAESGLFHPVGDVAPSLTLAALRRE
jgi:hypothetical protein